jgi:uncharacterized protein (DUF58 family)
VCGASLRAPAGRRIASRADISSRAFPRAAASRRRICRIVKTPVKWPFLWYENFDAPGRASPLHGVPTGCVARKRGVGNTGFAPQKKIARISPKSAMRRAARRRISRIGAKRFAKRNLRPHSERRRSGSQRQDQTSSFALMSSFTACGLALPPDAFIT